MTKAERYGKAVGEHFHAVADYMSAVVSLLTESKEHKKKRKAQEKVGEYVSDYLRKRYECETPHNPSADYDRDESLRTALQEIGVSKETWLKDCEDFLHLNKIIYYKERLNNYKNTPLDNEVYLNHDDDLKEALAYFCIPNEEWIKYGTKVLIMYDLYVKK